MKRIWIMSLMSAVLAGLAACGPLQQDRLTFGAVRGIVAGGADESPAPSPPLTRAFIEAQPVDLLRISIISRGAAGLTSLAGRNGGKVTWIGEEGIGFVFDNGLLIGTRGLGDDLMGADVSGAIRSLNGGGNHLRTLDFMNGLDQIERLTFRCTTAATGSETITIFERSYATTVIEERCRGDIGTFTNTYWRDGSGTIWQSRQWISLDVGYLGYQRL